MIEQVIGELVEYLTRCSYEKVPSPAPENTRTHQNILEHRENPASARELR